MDAAGILPMKPNPVELNPVNPKNEAWVVAIRVFCFYDRESRAVKKYSPFAYHKR
jgi:hypothetical protein